MPFDAQPTLRGPTLRVRPLTPEDFDALFAVARDPLIWEQHPQPDRHRPDAFRQFFDDAMASGAALVVETDGGEVFGSSRYHGYDEERSEVEIGWTFLARAFWGETTNRELKTLMLDHAFRSVRRVVFRVGPGNIRSQRAVEKLGARRAGTRQDGSGRTSVVFTLDRSDDRT